MTVKWTSGNLLKLLENGEAFFPAVFDAIRKAVREEIKHGSDWIKVLVTGAFMAAANDAATSSPSKAPPLRLPWRRDACASSRPPRSPRSVDAGFPPRCTAG